MGILWKCCLRALKENKIRTIVTILGVALATALITTVTCALSSTLESSIQYLKKSGDWHGRYVDVKQEDLKYFQENQSLEGVWLAKKLGSAYVNDEEDTALTVMAPEQSFYEHLNVRLTEGRWPEKEGEILLGADLRLNGKKLKPGDVVNLSVGENCFHDESYEDRYQNSLKIKEEKTYVVVGILRESLNYSAPTVMKNGRSCRSYDAYVFDENPRDKYDILIRYRKDALRRFVEVNQALLDITPEVYKLVYKSQMSNDYRRPSSEQLEQAHKRAADFQLNEILTVLEAAPNIIIKETDYVLIYMLVMTASSIVFLLIILAGVFCIDNSFDVSFMERIRFYGMLASVGTTKRQKRLIVWMEAFVIGIFGIPLGILAGILFTDLLITIVNLSIEAYLKKMEITIALSVAWWGILISAILAMFMICLSAMGSATHASRIMPIEAIRNSDVVKKGKKKEKRFKTPKLIGKVFGIGGTVAWQNFKRSKVKYRATVSSIAISVALFLGMSFIRPLFQMAKEDIATYMKWNLEVLASGGFYEMLEFVKDNPEVERSVIMSSRLMSFKDKTYVDDNQKEHRTFYISALDDASFESYCRQCGIETGDLENVCILNATRYIQKRDENKVLVQVPVRYLQFEPGDELRGEVFLGNASQGAEPGPEISIRITCQTDLLPEIPVNMEGIILLFVSESYARKHNDIFDRGILKACFMSPDAYSLEQRIEDSGLNSVYIVNNTEYFDMMKFMETLVIVILASFIAVIVLIGVTNVINAVNTNLELRSPEFAKLKAIGMTERQFQAMLWTEGLFIGGKGLLFGIPIGYFISYALYRYSWESADKTFQFAHGLPLLQTFFAVAAVAATLFLVLHFGRLRFEKRTLIETIRMENL